jgi:hypothetical protein
MENAFFIHPLISVSAKKIALRLYQVGGQQIAAIGVELV